MELRFSALTGEALTNRSEGDVFVNVEADLAVLDGDREIFAEVRFPVVELAVALRGWKAQGDGRGAFVLESVSLDGHELSEDGTWWVRIVPVDGGWQVVNDAEELAGSVLSPDEIDRAIDEFAGTLRQSSVDLLGPWIDEFFG
ncbi:DUF7878 domain-containing protein [Qaidamihabitans albus]|uniref:DUF7878 domain-containing protein n=1 Tax=Qaidamihabitans albus TaxID=2795733 RepID=UPI0018F1F6D6|nr:hypothetical protein [Qaidamihabitans albus]